jgi:hypothetical protein
MIPVLEDDLDSEAFESSLHAGAGSLFVGRIHGHFSLKKVASSESACARMSGLAE